VFLLNTYRVVLYKGILMVNAPQARDDTLSHNKREIAL